MGRRIRKTVKDGSQTVLTDEKFCYDGWNLLAVINAANNNSTKTFLWGLDLSGSQQGAGGVGGLLSIWQSGDGSHFACYDGNGNVMKLMSASTVTATANYEYSPFGDVVLASGTAATANPFRFSTKYQDDETGLFYYGYRYYIPGTGRWASRDPIHEFGGVHLYGFCFNTPLGAVDSLGKVPFSPTAALGKILGSLGPFFALVGADDAMNIYTWLVNLIAEGIEKQTLVHDVLCPQGSVRALIREREFRKKETGTASVISTGTSTMFSYTWDVTREYKATKTYACCRGRCNAFNMAVTSWEVDPPVVTVTYSEPTHKVFPSGLGATFSYSTTEEIDIRSRQCENGLVTPLVSADRLE